MLTAKFGNGARTISGENMVIIRLNCGTDLKSDFQGKLKHYNTLLDILILHPIYAPKLFGRCESVYMHSYFFIYDVKARKRP